MAKRIRLEPKLDTSAAEGLAGELAAAEGEDTVLDGAAVELLGGLCLELILSARHLRAKAGRSLTLADPSPALAEDLRRFGLSTDLAPLGGVAA